MPRIDSDRRPSIGFTIFLGLVFVALAVEVCLLVWKNRELRHQVTRMAESSNVPKLLEGQMVDSLTLVNESGEDSRLVFAAGQPATLIFLYSYGCGACEEMYAVWSDLVPPVVIPSLRVVAISLDTAVAASDSQDVMSVPVYSLLPQTESVLSNIRSVPMTLWLDQYGVVKHVWLGRLTPAVEELLRKKLTDIRES